MQLMYPTSIYLYYRTTPPPPSRASHEGRPTPCPLFAPGWWGSHRYMAAIANTEAHASRVVASGKELSHDFSSPSPLTPSSPSAPEACPTASPGTPPASSASGNIFHSPGPPAAISSRPLGEGGSTAFSPASAATTAAAPQFGATPTSASPTPAARAGGSVFEFATGPGPSPCCCCCCCCCC